MGKILEVVWRSRVSALRRLRTPRTAGTPVEHELLSRLSTQSQRQSTEATVRSLKCEDFRKKAKDYVWHDAKVEARARKPEHA